MSGSGWPREGQVALTLDSDDTPYVVYATSGTSNRLTYTTRVGGGWTPPVAVVNGADLAHPSMATSLDGSLHLAWLANSRATHSTIGFSHFTGVSWSAAETVSAGDSSVLSNGNSDQGPSIATDTNNTPYVLFMDGTVAGADDYVRMRYRTAGRPGRTTLLRETAGVRTIRARECSPTRPRTTSRRRTPISCSWDTTPTTSSATSTSSAGSARTGPRMRRSIPAVRQPRAGRHDRSGDRWLSFGAVRSTAGQQPEHHRRHLLRRAGQLRRQPSPRDGVLQGDRDRL